MARCVRRKAGAACARAGPWARAAGSARAATGRLETPASLAAVEPALCLVSCGLRRFDG